MKGKIGAVGLTFVVASLAACGVIRDAEMAVPSQLAASAERVELTGMGGWYKGDFQLAGSRGRFTRSSQDTGYFDGHWVTRRGGGTFSLSGPDVSGELSGRCRFAEAELSFGLFEAKPRRLDYVCDFARDGQPIDAKLMLRENNVAIGGMTPQERREGRLAFEGREIGLRSVHHVTASRIPTNDPIGYLFDAGGAPVGSVDLNGSNHSLLVPRDPALREVSIAAAVALSIFWDPAGDADRYAKGMMTR